MTWTRIKATGRGAVRFRVRIEGWHYELVTDESDAGAIGDGRSRLAILTGTGDWVFSETVDLIGGKLDVKGLTVSCTDRGGDGTACFDTQPTDVAYLDSADITNASTTITVNDQTTFASSGVLHIGTEAITYTAKSGSTQFTGCTRAAWGSYATYHYVPDGLSRSFTEVTDYPRALVGRRVEVYAYGPGETIGGSDTPIWIGIASSGATYDGITWSFEVDSIAARLKQKLGGDLTEPMPIRGIYYPASAPLSIGIIEYNGDTGLSSAVAETRFLMCGFWETQADFIEALNTEIATQVASAISGTFTQTPSAIGDESGWSMTFTTTSGAPHQMMIYGLAPGGAYSPVDGIPDNHARPFTVTASTRYVIPTLPQSGIAGCGTVPRMATSWGEYVRAARPTVPDASWQVNLDEAIFPSKRFYLGGPTGVVAGVTAAQIEWSSNGSAGEATAFTAQTLDVYTVNTSSNYIETSLYLPFAGNYAATSTNVPTVRLGRQIGNLTGAGTLATLFSTLTSAAVQYAPLGTMPMIRTTEIGAGDLTLVEVQNPLTANRRWTLWDESDLEDVVAEECRLRAVFPCLASSGNLTFRRLRLPSLTEAVDFTLDADSIKVRTGTQTQFFLMEQTPFGIVNQWRMQIGYDAVEDEWNGDTIIVRDQSAIAAAGGRIREIAIKARSENDVTGEAARAAAVQLAQRFFGVFASNYSTFTIKVPLTVLSGTPILCGDVVQLQWSKLPAGDGTLGTTATTKLGIVIGRQVAIRRGTVELKMILSNQRFAGYTPGGKITAISGTSGTTGPFTVTLSSDYFKSGVQALDLFTAGDKIRLCKWDSVSAATVTATISSVAANQLVFTSDANWTHAGSTWFAGYVAAGSTSVAHQKLYAYVAASDGRVTFGDGDVNAYGLSP